MIARSIRPNRGERWRMLPGDELISSAHAMITHGITIQRPRREVWPWLVQMGGGRAGWYSYDRIDNDGRPSADRIIPELQQVKEGDVFPAVPGNTEGFVVLSHQAEQFLVLGWPSPEGIPAVTWAFVLEEAAPGCTRLMVRVRVGEGYRPPLGLPHWVGDALMPLGHFVMQRKQLLGIARRAEAGSLRRAG